MMHVTLMVEGRVMYSVLEGKPERNNPPGIPSFIWIENIKENLKEVVVKTASYLLRIGTGFRHL